MPGGDGVADCGACAHGEKFFDKGGAVGVTTLRQERGGGVALQYAWTDV